MNFMSTVKGSNLEGFYPAGWDFDKMDACIDAPEKITERQAFWNEGFTPIKCDSLGEFETYTLCIGKKLQNICRPLLYPLLTVTLTEKRIKKRACARKALFFQARVLCERQE